MAYASSERFWDGSPDGLAGGDLAESLHWRLKPDTDRLSDYVAADRRAVADLDSRVHALEASLEAPAELQLTLYADL